MNTPPARARLSLSPSPSPPYPAPSPRPAVSSPRYEVVGERVPPPNAPRGKTENASPPAPPRPPLRAPPPSSLSGQRAVRST